MDLQRIEIDIPGNFKFVMEPRDSILYDINEASAGIINRLAVIYKLTLIDYQLPDTDVNHRIESYTTYYISDAKTNNFRANLLLPFLCIKDETVESHLTTTRNDTSCLLSSISDNYKRGLLYKVSACDHLNFNNIHRRMEQIQDADNLQLSTRLKSNLNVGIMSVLPRMNNIVDFLLALTSKKLSELNDKYTFISDNLNNLDITIRNKTDGTQLGSHLVEYNFMSYDGIEGHIRDIDIYDNNIRNLNPIDPTVLSNRSAYRRLLIRQFARWNQLIKNNGELIRITYVSCQRQNINLRAFNQLLRVCENNDFSETSRRYFVDYRTLSNNLNLKIRELATTNTNISTIFHDLFIPAEHLICRPEDLNYHMKNGWRSDCDTLINKILTKSDQILELYGRILRNEINIITVIKSDILLIIFLNYYRLLEELKRTNVINTTINNEMLSMCGIIAEKYYVSTDLDFEQKNMIYENIISEIDSYTSPEKIRFIHAGLDINTDIFKQTKSILKNEFRVPKYALRLLVEPVQILRFQELQELDFYYQRFNTFLQTGTKQFLNNNLFKYLVYGEILLKRYNRYDLRNNLTIDDLEYLKRVLLERINRNPQYPQYIQEYRLIIGDLDNRILTLAPPRPKRPATTQQLPESPLSKRFSQAPGQTGGFIYKQKYLKYKQKYLELQKMMKNIN